jgi:hypothetical protein
VQPVLLRVAITAVLGSLIAARPAAAQQSAQQPTAGNGGGTRSERRQIVSGPALEKALPTTAFIRWTVDAGGGTRIHYAVVRYGTDPGTLGHTAMSPNRWARGQPVTYRVRIDRLTPGTTYYYTVDARQANGVSMGLNSPVKQFTTPPGP